MFSSFWAFALFLFFWTISPGPMVTLTSRYSIKYGIKGGLAMTAGVILSDIIYLFLAFVGIATFISKHEKIFHYATIIGGIYILYIGISIIISANKTKKDFISEEGFESNFNPMKVFVTGFIATILSPVTIVGMTAFILPFFKPDMALGGKIFFAFLVPFTTFYCFLLISAVFGNKVTRKFVLPKMVWFERIAGAVISYMAIMVIFFQ